MKLFSKAPLAKPRRQTKFAAPSQELGQFANDVLEELESHFPLKQKVDMEWRNLRVAAGRATYQLFHIALSAPLLIDEERVASTIKHEYAHLLAFSRHGKRGMGHGELWKQAMRDLGEEPTVRHCYEVERNAKRQVVTYECAHCRTRIHRRRRLPKRRKYVHANCGGPLKFVSVERVAP